LPSALDLCITIHPFSGDSTEEIETLFPLEVPCVLTSTEGTNGSSSSFVLLELQAANVAANVIKKNILVSNFIVNVVDFIYCSPLITKRKELQIGANLKKAVFQLLNYYSKKEWIIKPQLKAMISKPGTTRKDGMAI
jgi:hypothetical protein